MVAFGVSTRSFLNIARELTVGTPLLGTVTMPMEQGDYSPEDVPKFLPDEAIRGVMTPLFNEIRGVQEATMSFGGPAFLDTDGYWLDNLFGDLTTTSNGTLGGAQTFTGGTAVGATTFTVASSLGAVTTGSIIQVTDAGPPAANEVVIATAGSSGTVINCTNTPLRFAHSTSATGALQTAATNYTHKFALLNTGLGQPPTHSVTDFTNLTASVGARTYPSVCLSGMDISGNTEQLLQRKITANSWQSAAASGSPVAATSFVKPQANWQSTITVGGSSLNTIGEWSCSIKRKLQTYWTATNTQTPYVIARGGLTMSWGLQYSIPSDESPLTNMLTSGPLAVVASLSNGLSGANALSITITSTTAQFVKAKPTRNNVAIGYDDQAEAVANATDAGGSGGQGPGTISITNAISTY